MIPRVSFLGSEVSRLIVGDNPVNGHSYIPELISYDDMLDYYTEQNLLTAMARASELGYNTWLPLANEFMLRAIRHYRNTGAELQVIFQSYPPTDFAVNVREMAACKPLGIYHQGTTTDGLSEAGQYQLIRDRLKMIRDAGISAGIGTHVPETVMRAEDEGWETDFYVTCLHNTRTRGAAKESSFITGKSKHLKFFPEDRPLMLQTIRQVAKPCIAFKVFAGGQIFYHKNPSEVRAVAEAALREVMQGIKPNDIAAIGCFQRDKDQLAENAAIMQSLTREADQAQVSTSAPVHYFDLQAPFGPLRIVERAGAIIAIDLSPKAVPAGWQATATPLLEEAAAQLQAYCARQRRDFSLPLAPEGTSFQTSVWRAMQAIPYGQVSTYGAIARQLGNPRASRAVGSAINRNPIPIIIPCHRVVGADGSLVGYAGGLEVKRYLLDLEQGAGA